MGKVAAAAAPTMEMNKPRKKKGRPPKNRQFTPPYSINYNSTPSTSRRSGRRNPNSLNSPTEQPEFDDDDDERKEKKVKLVVRLPESQKQVNQLQQNRRHSQDYDSVSGSDPDSADRDSYAKKRKINFVDRGSDDGVSIQEKDEMKGTDSPVHGSPLESGPTTPLPDKKLLIFILDRLQKKDTHGVFSEPVDPDELPDYFEIIEQPMDFGTVRKKLDSGTYKNLEELEGDISLICSNAMQYNAPDTVYYRQARSIQELAKRDFQNLRNEGEDGEPQPKVVRRGRPPGIKTLKKYLEASSINYVVPETSSCATLANEEEKAGGSNSYNLRKTPMQSRFRSTDSFVSSYFSRTGENHSDYSANWNNEFPANILRADIKYGNKHFTVDESRRHTYNQFSGSDTGSNLLVLSNLIGAKQLVMVGLQEPLAYGRSLARYAATLGPVAWKIASNKIQASVPAGLQYGPGWVGENGPPTQPSSFSNEKQKSSNSTADFCNSSQLLTPSTSDPTSAVPFGPSEGMVKAVRKLNSPNEQKPVFQPHVNSFVGKSSLMQQRYSLSDPPDLNVRVQVGSPQQPDLALQL